MKAKPNALLHFSVSGFLVIHRNLQKSVSLFFFKLAQVKELPLVLPWRFYQLERRQELGLQSLVQKQEISLVQWDWNGSRVQDFNLHPCAVLCFCTFVTRLYVGYVSGLMQVLDLEGNLIVEDSLMSWLGSAVSDVGIVVVGLQDMGAGFLAMSASKETRLIF